MDINAKYDGSRASVSNSSVSVRVSILYRGRVATLGEGEYPLAQGCNSLHRTLIVINQINQFAPTPSSAVGLSCLCVLLRGEL